MTSRRSSVSSKKRFFGLFTVAETNEHSNPSTNARNSAHYEYTDGASQASGINIMSKRRPLDVIRADLLKQHKSRAGKSHRSSWRGRV